MKLYCLQIDIVWEDKAANFEKVRRLLELTHPPRGSVVVLPEMFATGFSMNVAALAEGGDSTTARFLSETARASGVYVVAGSIGRGTGGRGLNQCAVYSPEGLELARYDKLQPFSLGEEDRHYEAGNRIVLWPCGGFRASSFICYDLRFPEVFRQAVRRGAELMTVIANWPIKRVHHWVALLQARAVENQCYVAGVNRCGRDPHLVYNGRSLIVGPSGDILADAGEAEGAIGAEIEPELVRSLREGLPFLRDMRDDYERLH